MTGRIRPVIKKEFRQIARDPRTLVMLLILPAFLLIMYGYALNFDVKHIPLAVLDQDHSRQSRDFIRLFLQTEYFDLNRTVAVPTEVDRLLDEGKVSVVLVIPYGFSRHLLAGREAAVQVLLDGEEAGAAGTAVGYLNAIVRNYSAGLALQAEERSGRRTIAQPVDFRPRVWYNPELRSARFLVPGLMAFVLMITVVISTSFSVVRERERGTMEQLIVSPLRPSELIIGKTIPYILISLISSHLVLMFGYILFDVGIKGDYFLLLAAMLFFLTSGLGLGLLISTVARSQQVAFMIAVISTMLPTFVLSGFVFPIRNMPEIIQAITYLIPARYFLIILRGIMLKGVGFPAVWENLLVLLGFSILTVAASSFRMRRMRRLQG